MKNMPCDMCTAALTQLKRNSRVKDMTTVTLAPTVASHPKTTGAIRTRIAAQQDLKVERTHQLLKSVQSRQHAKYITQQRIIRKRVEINRFLHETSAGSAD